MTSIMALVPSSVSSLRPELPASFSLVRRTAAMKPCGSSTLTPREPRTATAFRFFEPMTAPTPERPAARCRSLTMQA
jgi:hypothetical protein